MRPMSSTPKFSCRNSSPGWKKNKNVKPSNNLRAMQDKQRNFILFLAVLPLLFFVILCKGSFQLSNHFGGKIKRIDGVTQESQGVNHILKSPNLTKVSEQTSLTKSAKLSESEIESYLFARASVNKSRNDSTCCLSNVLFYNRVPKSGSSNFIRILRELSNVNNFKLLTFGAYDHMHLKSREERRKHMKNVLDIASTNVKKPVVLQNHVYFTDFGEFGKTNPVYFNMVRHPVDKFQSRFYFERSRKGKIQGQWCDWYDHLRRKKVNWVMNVSKQEYYDKKLDDCILMSDPECKVVTGEIYKDFAMPYFCGHKEECLRLNSKWALDNAKRNVERFFPVVGVLEELRTTLIVLQDKLPRYFDGVVKLFDTKLKDKKVNHGVSRPRLDLKARQALVGNLTMELQFYEWARQRLAEQESKMQQNKKDDSHQKPFVQESSK